MTPILILLAPALVIALGAALAYALTTLEHSSGAALRLRKTASPLAHELPYWTIDDTGTIVGVDLTYSAGLVLEGCDTDCLDDGALAQMDRALHGVLQVLPAGALVQCMHLADHDHTALLGRYRAAVTASTGCARQVIDDKVAAIEHARSLRRSRLYLLVSLPRRGADRAARLGMARRFPPVNLYQHEEDVRRLGTLVDSVAAGLLSAGVAATRLAGDEVRALVYELLNPHRARRVPAPGRRDTLPYADEQTAREQLCLASLREEASVLELDGQLVRVVTLRDLPGVTEPALLEALTVGLGLACRVQVAIEILDDQRALDDLKRRRDQAHALATLRERRNQEAEAKEEDVADLIDRNLRASLRMVRLGLSVTLSVDAAASDARERLEHQTTEVLRVLAGMHGAQGMVETYGQLDAFLSTLPAGAHHHTRWHTCTSENAAHFLLCWQSWPGHRRPAVLLENGRNQLLGLDPFDPALDNPNAFMAGASGAGKSVTTNYLLLHLFSAGVKGLVIDVGGSYRKLLTLYGGDYVTFAAASDPALNLFYEPADVVSRDGALDPLRLRFMLAVLETLLADREHPELGNEARAVLDGAIRQLYADATAAPLLSDLAHVLQTTGYADEEDARIAHRLVRGLRYWTSGPHARLLNRPSTVRLTSEFAGFDLKGLPEDVQAPVLLILSALIWNLILKNPAERKVVVFDEVWTLLRHPASAQLLEELYRTSRKYRTSILSISQSVDDFVGSSIAAALVNNAATTYLLRHRAGHDVIAETFHLSARERFVFEGLEMRRGEYSELLLLAGRTHHTVARVVLTPLEYWIATTHPADQSELARLAAERPDLPLLDQLRLCAARYPAGAPEDADQEVVLEGGPASRVEG